jgi:hypothetical protein
MRNKSLGRECDPVFVPRSQLRFQIRPNSSPRKVQRWLNRGGGSPLLRSLEAIAADHVHPKGIAI